MRDSVDRAHIEYIAAMLSRPLLLSLAVSLSAACAPPPPRVSPAPPEAAEPPLQPLVPVAVAGPDAPKVSEPVKITYVRARRLFAGTGDRARENMVIIVSGDRIQRVAPAEEVTVPKDASVV